MQPRGVYGRFGVEDLAERADARFVQVRREAFETAPRARLVVRMDLEPGIDERADQPAPDRALVVGGVARAQVAVVLRLVVAVPGASERRPTGVSSRSRTTSKTGCQRARSSTGWSSEIARI